MTFVPIDPLTVTVDVERVVIVHGVQIPTAILTMPIIADQIQLTLSTDELLFQAVEPG